MMFSDVPNLIATFGYTTASWTLGADLTSEYACKLINLLDKKGMDYFCPEAGKDVAAEGDFLDLTSGYIQRVAHMLPKQGSKDPWINTQNYLNVFNDYPYIFNLGHGILPTTKPETIKYIVQMIREGK